MFLPIADTVSPINTACVVLSGAAVGVCALQELSIAKMLRDKIVFRTMLLFHLFVWVCCLYVFKNQLTGFPGFEQSLI
jgi:hypothetical protein